jgi:hypothetical protein
MLMIASQLHQRCLRNQSSASPSAGSKYSS